MTKPHHNDPPGLWIGVTLVSIAFHLGLFWMLRSVVSEEKSGNVKEAIVPIETIAIAQKNPKPHPQLLQSHKILIQNSESLLRRFPLHLKNSQVFRNK